MSRQCFYDMPNLPDDRLGGIRALALGAPPRYVQIDSGTHLSARPLLAGLIYHFTCATRLRAESRHGSGWGPYQRGLALICG